MAYKKKTMRKMYPLTRNYARLINDLESVARRLKNLKPKIDDLEFQARSLAKAKQHGLIQDDTPIFDKETDRKLDEAAIEILAETADRLAYHAE
jgi:hypothetical protein